MIATRPYTDVQEQPGLSLSHISPRTRDRDGKNLHLVNVSVNGGLVSMQRPQSERVRRGGGKRKRVTGFSREARNRARNFLGTVDRRVLPLLVTLTYPGSFDRDPATWKRHLDTVWKRVERAYGEASCVWVLEFQKRSAPHYHLLVWGISDVVEFRRFLSEAWYEVVGSTDERHFRAGTQVVRARSSGAVTGYIASYIGKADQKNLPEGYEGVGRWWGKKRSSKIPISEVQTLLTTERGHNQITRLMRKAANANLRDKGSKRRLRGYVRVQSLVMKDPRRFRRVLTGLGYAVDPDIPLEPPRSLKTGGWLP